jgi:nicotinamidase-related amidase
VEKSPHFEPDQCALLLIDHQVGTIPLIKNITADQSIRNAVTLAKAALAFDMPIVMTSSWEDHIQGALHPSLARIAAVTTDICLIFPTISAVEARYEVQAVLDASGSSFAIGEETSRRRMERAGVWLTWTYTVVAELVGNWATPRGMALIPLLAADPPMLAVY